MAHAWLFWSWFTWRNIETKRASRRVRWRSRGLGWACCHSVGTLNSTVPIHQKQLSCSTNNWPVLWFPAMALLMCNKVKQHWSLFIPVKFVVALLTILCRTWFTSGRKKSFSQVKGVHSSLPQSLFRCKAAAAATLLSQSGYCWLISRLSCETFGTDEHSDD